jgi:predicted CoA-substrate-specific enzyme activase
MATSLGICVGATTVSAVQIEANVSPETREADLVSDPIRVKAKIVRPHAGDLQKALSSVLEEMDLSQVRKIAATGRKFRHLIQLPSISEPEAVEHAYRYAKPPGIRCPAVISAGGETFMVYKLDPRGRISNVFTGNKCAAGTGEFFQQQLRRLDTSLDQVSAWNADVDPYPVSGRCSVFCKSDCTHATNKGIAKEKVVAGLGQMMAGKIIELLKSLDIRNVMLTGGTSQNQMMVRHLQKVLPGLIIPEHAPYYEALGAASWALDQPDVHLPPIENLFTQHEGRFEKLPPLAKQRSHVEFKTLGRDQVRTGDVCLLGLDVGSTTTKAVLLRQSDNAMLASVYLRTNGDPVGASRKCYAAIASQVEEKVPLEQIHITGIGVCGSGRHIAGLHAMTDGVINEITAHATAAIFFDPEVDTIFEIGGQDAKYTHITNGVPSDYAMNEACSAGTGSFLEESAWETMGIAMEEIAEVAMKGQSPPNFSDQCAAFIASDIKNAIQEGVAREDIVAGLVYSVCMNYSSRVKGNRPVGDKVFMQGGVCYNHAVPLAMADLTGKKIIVPPEPGLMGAYGVALEVRKRQDNGLMSPGHYCLRTLTDRDVAYGRSFICKGGKNNCDRRCSIARIEIEGRAYPFGGACNRYDNLRQGRRVNTSDFNLVRTRQELVFGKYAPTPLNRHSDHFKGRIGINRSFMVNTYYPLYAHFFSALGFEPVLPEEASPVGIDQRNAPFCFPGELAHGFFHALISDPDPPDYIFLPHLRSLPTLNGERHSQTCPLVQAEPFYLQATFRKQLEEQQKRGTRLLAPLLDLSNDPKGVAEAFVAMAREMGISRTAALAAFDHAWAAMQACLNEMRDAGRRALERLDNRPEAIGIVLFARPYNGYVSEAHMGIPDKFASRDILVMPLDFLDIAAEPSIASMYWGMGQRFMMAARKIKPHPQLYGTYITNFSCGPDSFVLNYFRSAMGEKPSLTLELDSHSADAGIETRIDAFLDIVQAHRMNNSPTPTSKAHPAYEPATITFDQGAIAVRSSDGKQLPLSSSNVTLLFPSMGEIGTDALAASFRSAGVKAKALPPSDEAILKIGKGNTSCKECLPLILTTGALLHYIRTERSPTEVVVYFMPNGSGPCRFGQYHIFMQDLIRKLKIPDVAFLSLSSDEGYDGLPPDIHRRAWRSVVASDVFEDIRAMLLTNARNVQDAMPVYHKQYQDIVKALETGRWRDLEAALKTASENLRRIPLKRPTHQVPRITLAGEIYVRRDGLSRQYLTEYLAAKGFAAVCTPVAEWVLYSDYLITKGLAPGPAQKGLKKRLKQHIKSYVMRKDERRIKKILATTELVHAAPVDIDAVIDTAQAHISPHLSGEAVLTVGSVMREVATETCGAIAIGPFGCMPNRISEAILMETMSREDKLAKEPKNSHLDAVLSQCHDLPFLAIESDGSPLSQQTMAKLEAFCLRADRLHQNMLRHNRQH